MKSIIIVLVYKNMFKRLSIFNFKIKKIYINLKTNGKLII